MDSWWLINDYPKSKLYCESSSLIIAHGTSLNGNTDNVISYSMWSYLSGLESPKFKSIQSLIAGRHLSYLDIIISRLLLSVSICTKVITLSSFHCSFLSGWSQFFTCYWPLKDMVQIRCKSGAHWDCVFVWKLHFMQLILSRLNKKFGIKPSRIWQLRSS